MCNCVTFKLEPNDSKHGMQAIFSSSSSSFLSNVPNGPYTKKEVLQIYP
jgi:hypothetical protein